jgi:hypothetical protein
MLKNIKKDKKLLILMFKSVLLLILLYDCFFECFLEPWECVIALIKGFLGASY